MSNAKRAKWTQAEVDAGNALRLLGDLWTEGEAHAARTVIMRDVAARLAGAGAEPGVLAALDQAVAAMAGDEDWDRFWAQQYRDLTGL